MKNWQQALLIVAVGCFITLPVLVGGLSIRSDDGATHVVWYTNFASQFWSGDLYPRWLANVNDGLGSPAFFYYPPVPYFLTSLLKPLFGTADPNGIHQLGISAAVSVILSGLFAWRWCREFADDLAALVGGVAFMITPYHLVIDLYTRSSFAELWSFAWIPLILLFVHRLVRGGRWAFVGLAISYALLIGTHLPATLIFSAVPVVYAIFVAEKEYRLIPFLLVVGSMALGVGLSAIFLYPAIEMQQFVFLDRMSLGHFSYSNWLLLSGFYYEANVDLRPIARVTFVFLDLIVLIVAAFIFLRRSTDTSLKRLSLFWFLAGAISFLMTTDISRPIWSLTATLQKVQFPFRFGVVISVAVTGLLALAFARLCDARDEFPICRAAVIFCAFVWIPFAAWGCALYATPVTPEDAEFKDRIVRERREQPEYRPRWSRTMAAIDWNASTNEDAWSEELQNEYEDLVARTGARDPRIARATIISGAGDVGVLKWKPREITLRTSSRSATSVRVQQFYFPGWQARLADGAASLDVRPSEPDGLLSVDVPAGEHDVIVTLERTDAEHIGGWVSAGSLLCLGFCAIIMGVFSIRGRWRVKNV